MPRHWAISPGVVALPKFTGGIPVGPPRAPPIPPAYTSVGAGPLSPWLPVWLGPLLMVALGGVGWPWVVATLPGANPRIRAGLAPAVGIAVLSLYAIVVDAVGLRLDGWGAVVAIMAALGTGLFLLARTAARGSDETAPRGRLRQTPSPLASSSGLG